LHQGFEQMPKAIFCCMPHEQLAHLRTRQPHGRSPVRQTTSGNYTADQSKIDGLKYKNWPRRNLQDSQAPRSSRNIEPRPLFRFYFGFRYGPPRSTGRLAPASEPCGVAASDDVRRQRAVRPQELKGKLLVREAGLCQFYL
jgi:hypothetical protein